ncbi:hypothetical protein D3C86_1877800 [compost metagenome]
MSWVRVLNDGFKKHKKKRLPSGDNQDFQSIETTLKNFIINGNIGTESKGILEFKPISSEDVNLELIPSNYLDNPVISTNQITSEMKKVFTEITFQGIKKALHENI